MHLYINFNLLSLDRVKAEMEVKLKELEEHKNREVEEMRLEKQDILTKLDVEKRDLERQKEELEATIHREKLELDKEREVLEREKLDEIEGIIREKENEIEELKEKAQHEIDELRDRLDETERSAEFATLHYNHAFHLLTLGRTRGAGGCRPRTPLKVFLSFFLEDKTSARDVFSSCSFILCANFETSSVMVSCFGQFLILGKIQDSGQDGHHCW